MAISKTNLVYKLQKLYKKAFHEANSGRPPHAILPGSNPISRKEFIGNTAMASASLLVPAFLQSPAEKDSLPRQKTKVAIVGGGIAGLNACHILSKEKQIEVTLYEANKRTGGRIFTAKNLLGENLTTELGGEFIDSSHSEMLDLIKEFRLEIYDVKKDTDENHLSEHTYFFGNKVREEKELLEEFKKIIPALQRDKARIEDDTAISELDKLSLKSYLEQLHVQGWFYDLIYWAFTAEFGVDASELSCLNFIDMVGLDTREGFAIFGDSDERFKIKGGNQSLTDAMTATLTSHIRLSHKLTAILKRSSGIILQFENGKNVSTDFVLLAIPFSVLRDVKIGQDIHFPESKRKMISALPYGTNSKMLLGFNERPWRLKASSGYLINEEIQNGWDNSQLQNDNKGSGGFTIFLGGKQGKELKDTALSREKYLALLEKIFTGAKSNYNNRHAVFNWAENPYTKGSYAGFKTGDWAFFDSDEMMKPVGNIFFAGEHCSKKSQGYMNGGAETGRKAAEDILKKMQEQNVHSSIFRIPELNT